ncbi:MAG: hypothetical protein ACI9TK_001220 [Flavobacteriaceae bacterium]|jgi:hypothetical protein|tara:strand:- start:2454 stop:2750 length:297 start_codon:yes stop_codon:yes gene_type:complete
MQESKSAITILEEKIIGLLNKLKGNHLDLVQLKEQKDILEDKFKSIEQKVIVLESENKSLRIVNNLLGSNERNQETKSKINSLIKEVDFCIQQVSEMN